MVSGSIPSHATTQPEGNPTSHTAGLVVGLLLLGYGLVEIPRSMWITANPEIMLKWCAHRSVVRSQELRVALTGHQRQTYTSRSQEHHRIEDIMITKYPCAFSLASPPVPLFPLRCSKHAESVMRSTNELETVIAIICANDRQMRRGDALRPFMEVITSELGEGKIEPLGALSW